MMKISLFVLGLSLLTTFSAMAETPQQVSVNIDGTVYSCTTSGVVPTDPNCIKDIASYCNTGTTNSSNACFTYASSACKGALTGYSSCVTQTAAYCSQSTTMSSNDCFTQSLTSCKS